MRNGRRTYLLTPTDDGQSGSEETLTEQPPPEQPSASSPPVESSDRNTPADTKRDEERALELIRERGSVYQSELWKELDVSSRTGSRIVNRLEEQEAIRREEAVYNGNRTYLLRPAKKDLDFSLLMAGDMLSPLVGDEEEVDPIESDAFTEWVLRLGQNQ